jgi:hypothetical protein
MSFMIMNWSKFNFAMTHGHGGVPTPSKYIELDISFSLFLDYNGRTYNLIIIYSFELQFN